jgi:hypothetical protein
VCQIDNEVKYVNGVQSQPLYGDEGCPDIAFIFVWLLAFVGPLAVAGNPLFCLSVAFFIVVIIT